MLTHPGQLLAIPTAQSELDTAYEVANKVSEIEDLAKFLHAVAFNQVVGASRPAPVYVTLAWKLSDPSVFHALQRYLANFPIR